MRRHTFLFRHILFVLSLYCKFCNALVKMESHFLLFSSYFKVVFIKKVCSPHQTGHIVLSTVQQGGMIFLLLAHMMQFAQLCQRRPEFLAFEGHKGHKAEKGRKGQKNKYGSKSLELPNSARNAKIAKNCQKEPKTSSSSVLAFKGLKLGI